MVYIPGTMFGPPVYRVCSLALASPGHTPYAQRVSRGMVGSRCEWSSVNPFGCCHQPWRRCRSLRLKNPSGYWRMMLADDTQHAGSWERLGGGGGCVAVVVAGPVTAAGYGLLAQGSNTLSGGAESPLQESVVQFDREASSPSGGSPRSGVTHREFSVLHRTVVAMSVDAGLSGACPCT